MLLKQEIVEQLLCCPKTRCKLKKTSSTTMVSTGKVSHEYSIVDGCPILVDFSKSILDERNLLKRKVQSCVKRSKYSGIFEFVKKIISPSKKITAKNVKNLTYLLKKDNSTDDVMILIVGGGSIGQGMEPIYNDLNMKIISFDIYKSDYTQFVADAHNLPLPVHYFDCVIIQAVLEHVLVPQKVVNEITKVLKPNGIVYSETPFLQHVHEGPYDFTRFTESGHRYLYKDYEEICSGASSGAGTQMLWSVDYFFRSVFKSRNVGKVFKILFFWLQYFDLYITEKYSVDAASGVYFLGKKSNNKVVPKDIVKHYKGAQ